MTSPTSTSSTTPRSAAVYENVVVQFIPTASYHEIESSRCCARRYSTDMITTPRHNGKGFEAVFRATKEGIAALKAMPYIQHVRREAGTICNNGDDESSTRLAAQKQPARA